MATKSKHAISNERLTEVSELVQRLLLQFAEFDHANILGWLFDLAEFGELLAMQTELRELWDAVCSKTARTEAVTIQPLQRETFQEYSNETDQFETWEGSEPKVYSRPNAHACAFCILTDWHNSILAGIPRLDCSTKRASWVAQHEKRLTTEFHSMHRPQVVAIVHLATLCEMELSAAIGKTSKTTEPEISVEDAKALGRGRSLKLFMELIPGKPVRHQQLFESCWTRGEAPGDDAIRKALNRMADKLDLAGRPYDVICSDPAAIFPRTKNGQ